MGLTGGLLITTANPAAISAEHRALALPVPAFGTREAMSYLSGRLGTDPDQRSGAVDLVGDLGSEADRASSGQRGHRQRSGMSYRDYRRGTPREQQKQLANAGRAEDVGRAAVTWTFSAEYAEHLSPGDEHPVAGDAVRCLTVTGYQAPSSPPRPCEASTSQELTVPRRRRIRSAAGTQFSA